MLQNNKGITKASSLAESRSLGKDILDGKPFDYNKYISIKLTCKKSFNKPDLFFCNMVDSRDRSNLIVQRIIDLKSFDGYKIKYSDFKYTLEETLRRNNKDRFRVDDILSLYNIRFIKNAYWKAVPQGILSNVSGKLPKDTLRIIVEKNDDTWNVLVIDPWHHLATDDFERSYKEHKKKYRYGIEIL